MLYFGRLWFARMWSSCENFCPVEVIFSNHTTTRYHVMYWPGSITEKPHHPSLWYRLLTNKIFNFFYLQKRFEGTRVTVESFLAWRKQFEIDMGIPAKREKESKDKTKLTGKELFLRDITLNESDLKFLEDG